MTPLGCSGGSQERLMVPAVALISSTVGTAEGAVQEYRERERVGVGLGRLVTTTWLTSSGTICRSSTAPENSSAQTTQDQKRSHWSTQMLKICLFNKEGAKWFLCLFVPFFLNELYKKKEHLCTPATYSLLIWHYVKGDWTHQTGLTSGRPEMILTAHRLTSASADHLAEHLFELRQGHGSNSPRSTYTKKMEGKCWISSSI